MEWLEMSTENCSIQRTLDIVGEKWTLLILREAVNGVRRFDDFHRHIGLSEPVLSARLRTLVAAGIMATRPYREPGKRTRQEYRLTTKGWDLWPALIALMQWGDRYAADPEGPPLDLRHHDCDAPVRATIACSAGHTALTPRDLEVHPGPSAHPLPTP